jgi:Rieske Fe-S protein
MDRKSFLKNCGMACLGATALVSFLESCGTTKHLNAVIEGSDIVVPLTAFERRKKGGIEYHKAIVVQNELLQDPIGVFRMEDGKLYTAMLMRCTHQGAQLQLFGDKFQCPAHGSEFDGQGQVQQGPAESPLRSFPIVVESQLLRISLK